jgi:hypothetical protein
LALARPITTPGAECVHVLDLDLDRASGETIWRICQDECSGRRPQGR